MRLVAGLCLFVGLAGCMDGHVIDEDEWDDADIPERPEIRPGPPTVTSVQQGSVLEGTEVYLGGLVVSAVGWEGIWVQSADGGRWSGLFVWLGAPADATTHWSDVFGAGDIVSVGGVVIEYSENPDQFAIDTVTMLVSSPSLVMITSSGPPPLPTRVDPFVLFDPATAEPYEGVLVTVVAPFVVDEDVGWGTFEVEPGVVIGNDLHDPGRPYFGDRYAAITGVLHFQYGRFELLPRSTRDIVGYSSEVTPLGSARVGDLVITEVMADPTACDDDEAEYIEMVNASDGILDLEGLAIDVGNQRFLVEDRFLVGPGDLVLAAPSDERCAGPVPHLVTGLSLADGGERIVLFGPLGELDAVDLSGDTATGASHSLDEKAWDYVSNDASGAWCPAGADDGELIGPNGTDLGSPGYVNETVCF